MERELDIQALLHPSAFPHDCEQISLIETHISWVILTGQYAYKIKKPGDFGFADFSSLRKRQHYCQEELRLNRRFAPDLYLEVVSIHEEAHGVRIRGEGPIVEYAVRMKQFDPQTLLSQRAAQLLDRRRVCRFASEVARFHRSAAVASSASFFGNPDQVLGPVRDNFQYLAETVTTLHSPAKRLLIDAEEEFDRLEPVFRERKAQGMIRECHGDLHLGNMFLQDDRIHLFDGIEFNEEFRWIDIISDIAFTIADFEEKRLPSLGRTFLNCWLEVTDDYFGLAVLPFYCAYRAAVRAKVDGIRVSQPGLSAGKQALLLHECRNYLDLCRQFTQRHRPAVIVTFGLSGSGKTMKTQELLESCDIIRLRSDVIRKAMFGLQPSDSSAGPIRDEMYSEQTSRQVYDSIAQTTHKILHCGYPVVIDATFLNWNERQRFIRLADRAEVPFLILNCSSDEDTLRNRIRKRLRKGGDASEANLEVLDQQLAHHDPLSPSEMELAVDANDDNAVAVVIQRAGLTR